MKIIPLGGLEGIGKNITVFEMNDEILVVDCGIMFPTDEMPGIDFLIPDFSYLVKNKKKIKGIVITHGHEDHIGAIPFLLNEVQAPIYATRLTIGLMEKRLEERPPRNKPQFIEIETRKKMVIGSFTLEFIRVNHSIIDGVGIAITTELGTIIHTGDFKVDFTPVDSRVIDISRFGDYGEQGVLLLMSDSTNAERPGFTRSEAILEGKLSSIFSTSKGRIIVATFASNIHRVQQVIDTAVKYNRKVAISGLTMLKNIEIARSLGYLKIKDDLIVGLDEAKALPDKKLAIIGTGSQGEPMSALSRMANGTHRHFKAKSGDTVIITASVIPGNERTVTNVVNSLMRLGADVHYDRDPDIHVSGHGSQEELKLMLSLTRPKYFLPIHGDYKHLKAHTRLAESLNIKPSNMITAQNGYILELQKNSFKKTGSLDLVQYYVDGDHIGDLSDSLISDRHAMSKNGIVQVTLVTSEGQLISDPVISIKGYSGMNDPRHVKHLEKNARTSAERALQKDPSEKSLEAGVRKSLQHIIQKRNNRQNPILSVNVITV